MLKAIIQYNLQTVRNFLRTFAWLIYNFNDFCYSQKSYFSDSNIKNGKLLNWKQFAWECSVVSATFLYANPLTSVFVENLKETTFKFFVSFPFVAVNLLSVLILFYVFSYGAFFSLQKGINIILKKDRKEKALLQSCGIQFMAYLCIYSFIFFLMGIFIKFEPTVSTSVEMTIIQRILTGCVLLLSYSLLFYRIPYMISRIYNQSFCGSYALGFVGPYVFMFYLVYLFFRYIYGPIFFGIFVLFGVVSQHLLTLTNPKEWRKEFDRIKKCGIFLCRVFQRKELHLIKRFKAYILENNIMNKWETICISIFLGIYFIVILPLIILKDL